MNFIDATRGTHDFGIDLQDELNHHSHRGGSIAIEYLGTLLPDTIGMKQIFIIRVSKILYRIKIKRISRKFHRNRAEVNSPATPIGPLICWLVPVTPGRQ